jgi:hypothetical protein
MGLAWWCTLALRILLHVLFREPEFSALADVKVDLVSYVGYNLRGLLEAFMSLYTSNIDQTLRFYLPEQHRPNSSPCIQPTHAPARSVQGTDNPESYST